MEAQSHIEYSCSAQALDWQEHLQIVVYGHHSHHAVASRESTHRVCFDTTYDHFQRPSDIGVSERVVNTSSFTACYLRPETKATHTHSTRYTAPKK